MHIIMILIVNICININTLNTINSGKLIQSQPTYENQGNNFLNVK